MKRLRLTLYRRRKMSARDRRAVLLDVRAMRRAFEAYIGSADLDSPEALRWRAIYRRRYRRILTRQRWWGSWGMYAMSAGETARYLTDAGDTRRRCGAYPWGRDLVRSSLNAAAIWSEHSAERLPR